MNIKWLHFRGMVKGLFESIPYTPLLENGDSSPYFGTYEGQKYAGFETSCCWDFSACEVAETRLQMYWKKGLLPQSHIDWLKANNYIDGSGDFYLSRRWVAILSGVKNNGNNPLYFWNIAKMVGLIPNSMLPYSAQEASKWITQGQFNNEYFNTAVITDEMRNLGKEFLKRFEIRAENITGGTVSQVYAFVMTYLKEGSLQICHPVPQDGSWNKTKVDMPVGRTNTDHATECYKYDSTQAYPVYDYDSYEPHLKQLSSNYLIPIITRISIVPIGLSTPKPISDWQKSWYNIIAWFKGIPLPYPSVQIGYAR